MTTGDMRPMGVRIRTYFGGTQFQGSPPGTDPAELNIGFRGQGEEEAYSYDSRFLYAVQGVDNPLMKIPLPVAGVVLVDTD